jgi:hypothetical protein
MVRGSVRVVLVLMPPHSAILRRPIFAIASSSFGFPFSPFRNGIAGAPSGVVPL